MFLRRLVRIRTHDAFPVDVLVAVAPRRGGGEIGAEPARLVPELRQHDRVVAPVVALVQPQRPILVEVLRGEQVDRQRLYAGRRLLVLAEAPCTEVWRAGFLLASSLSALRWSGTGLRKDVGRRNWIGHPPESSHNKKHKDSAHPLCSHVTLSSESQCSAVGTTT
jgi:hypothetical protein